MQYPSDMPFAANSRPERKGKIQELKKEGLKFKEQLRELEEQDMFISKKRALVLKQKLLEGEEIQAQPLKPIKELTLDGQMDPYSLVPKVHKRVSQAAALNCLK